jgi:hypothetical protein
VLDLRVLNRVCRTAPDGHVLDVAERLALEQGRELTRRTIELSLQSIVSHSPSCRPAPAVLASRHEYLAPRPQRRTPPP